LCLILSSVTNSKEIILLAIKFRIGGTLRYLSHAQMLQMFQRACIRAGINLCFSEGMNPRPKMSLPLPRPVSVESDDELLTIRVHTSEGICDTVKESLSRQLPEGCELISVDAAADLKPFQPIAMTYVFPVRREYLDNRLKSVVEQLSRSESLTIRKDTSKDGLKDKKIVDIRPFLKSIEINKTDIIAACAITPAGSVNPRQLLELLELDAHKLGGAIKRTDVQWQDV
jgi:radical SAM-linked protein